MFKVSKWLNLFMIIMIVASVFAFKQPAKAQTRIPQAGNQQYVPGEVVVVFSPGKSQQVYTAQAQGLAAGIRAKVSRMGIMGSALIQASPNVDINALVESLRSQPGVLIAEPNYLYSIPEPITNSEVTSSLKDFALFPASDSPEYQGKDTVAIPISVLQAMKSKNGSGITATYPNDPYLWWNNGWSWTGANIVWLNTTASANVCELDTGVDYLHPELTLSVIKGYDYYNGDADPMDDNGHGTHVAGIIVAKGNNGQGISGMSTGKVVAVKVLGADGWGTNFDVSQGIYYCANRADVKVLSMSLGGPDPSDVIHSAIVYAVNTKGKLLVAAAGNENSDTPIYPAGYSDASVYPEFVNKVISVAASGQWYDADCDGDGTNDCTLVDYNCRANYSNYGDWVSVSAPGTDIYSTLPWDRPFTLNVYDGFNTRYDFLSGTSMATPFVSASAARRWGYKPLETNSQIGNDIKSISPQGTYDYAADGACWPASMNGKSQVNVAALLERGAINATVYDSSTGLPLTGAQVMAYQGITLRGTGILAASKNGPYPFDTDPARIYMQFGNQIDIINLPAGVGYVEKVSMTGYTASPQPAFQHGGVNEVVGGISIWTGRTGVPPKSTAIDAVVGWWVQLYDEYASPSSIDLDTNVWLPSAPNPLDAGQPAKFIVGPEGNAFGFLEGDPTGTLMAFPFARWFRDGGNFDYGNGLRIEDTKILSRLAHTPLAANPALPYYPGVYNIMVTDYGQTIDHDSDSGTPEIPLLGVYLVPHLYIWKDGVIKLFVDMQAYWPINPYDTCNAHWWKAATITSGVSGTITYTPVNTCGDDTILPYVASTYSGQMEITK
jgi:subtilisin family serine protease